MRQTFRRFGTACILLLASTLSGAVFANSIIFAIAPEIPEPQPIYKKILKNADSKVLKTEVSYELDESSLEKAEVWEKLVEFLRRKTGLKIELALTDGQLGFETALSKGKFDMAYLSPLQFLQARESQSYQAIAKRKAQPLRGLVVVLDDDKARTLRDIETSALGFSSLLNYSNSVITRVSLKKVNIQPPLKLYPNSEEMLEALNNKQVRSISLAQHELDALAPDHAATLRILWETPGFTPYAMAVHPRVPFYSVNKLQRALASISRRDEYSDLLDQIHAVNGFEIARNSDWIDAENIRLESLNQDLNIIRP